MEVNTDLVPVLNGLYDEYGRLIERMSSVHAATLALHEVGKAYGIELPPSPHPLFVASTAGHALAERGLPAAAVVAPMAVHAAVVEPAEPVSASQLVTAPAVKESPVHVHNGKPGHIPDRKPVTAKHVGTPVDGAGVAQSATVVPLTPKPMVGARADLSLKHPPVVHSGTKVAKLTPPGGHDTAEGCASRPKGAWLTVDQFKEILSAWNPQINAGNLSLTDIYHGLRTRGCRYGSSLPPKMDLSDSNTVRILSNHLRHEWVPGYTKHCQTLQGFYAQGTLYKTIRDKAEAAVHFAFPEMAKAKMGRTPYSPSFEPGSRPLRTGDNSPFAGMKELVR